MTNPTNANASLAGEANAESADMGGLHGERSTVESSMCEVRRTIALVPAQNEPVTATQAVTFAELAQRCAAPTIGPKDGAGWLPAAIPPGPRTGKRVEAVTFLALDVEAAAEAVKDKAGEPLRDRYGDIVKRVTGAEPPDVEAMLGELALCGWRCILHTSYSHGGSILPEGADHPRYRLIFDLSRTLAPEEIKPLAWHVARLLGLGDCVDSSCMEPARLFYAPRCPEDRRHLFRHAVTDGAALDVDALLGEARKMETAKKKAESRRHGIQSASVIDPFNAANAPGAILEAHGYAPKGGGRWLAPGSTTGMPGVRLLPDSTPPRIYSSHSGDPLNDGHAHDAFDCWRILAHGGDTVRAVREAADGMPRQGAQEPPQAPRVDPAGQEAANDAWGFVWGDEMTSPAHLKPSEWAIRKVLPNECTGLLYGGWGTCKTFVAIDMAGCIANGMPWHGKPTQRGTVFYLAGEGEGGFARRLAAWKIANGASMAGLAFREMPKVRKPEELAKLVHTIGALAATRGAPRLIVLDTLFTALAGGQENDGKDMGEVFEAMKLMRQQFRCAVLAVHHTGHDGDRARGHSSMPAGVDVLFYLKAKKRDGEPTELELANPKQKDGKEHSPIFLTTESVEIAGLVDEEGELESSLVIRAPTADMVAHMRERADTKQGKSELLPIALDLRTRGHTLEQIAAQVNRDKATVSRWLKDAA